MTETQRASLSVAILAQTALVISLFFKADKAAVVFAVVMGLSLIIFAFVD
jgi:hypothetical protein